LGAKTDTTGLETTAICVFKSHNWELKLTIDGDKIKLDKALNPTIGS